MTDNAQIIGILTSIQSSIVAMQSDIVDIKQNQAAMRKDIDELKQNQVAMQKDIRGLKQEQDNMQNKLRELEIGQKSMHKDMEQQFQIVNTKLNAHYTVLEALEHRSDVHKAEKGNRYFNIPTHSPFYMQ